MSEETGGVVQEAVLEILPMESDLLAFRALQSALKEDLRFEGVCRGHLKEDLQEGGWTREVASIGPRLQSGPRKVAKRSVTPIVTDLLGRCQRENE